MGKRVTITDIARAAGVSVATVSRVLNNNARVTPAISEAVQRAISDTNYRPNRLAQSFARGSSKTITVMYDRNAQEPDLDSGSWSMFFAILSMGLQDVLEGTDYHLRIMSMPDRVRSGNKGEIRDWLFRDAGVTEGDPLVITNPRFQDVLLDMAVSDGSPIVVVGKTTAPQGIPQIDADNIESFRLITSHLLELGHRDLAFLSPNVPLTVVQDRYLGFSEAMDSVRSQGRWLECDASHGIFSHEGARARISRAITENHLPTGIVCFNDEMAFGAIQALSSHGIRVPQDVSVTGCDDLPPARMYSPPLTTIRQDIRQMGQHASRSLLRQIRGHTIPALTLLPVSLVVRKSTAPPAATSDPAFREYPNDQTLAKGSDGT